LGPKEAGIPDHSPSAAVYRAPKGRLRSVAAPPGLLTNRLALSQPQGSQGRVSLCRPKGCRRWLALMADDGDAMTIAPATITLAVAICR
jgi:hypothetical protein